MVVDISFHTFYIPPIAICAGARDFIRRFCNVAYSSFCKCNALYLFVLKIQHHTFVSPCKSNVVQHSCLFLRVHIFSERSERSLFYRNAPLHSQQAAGGLHSESGILCGTCPGFIEPTHTTATDSFTVNLIIHEWPELS